MHVLPRLQAIESISSIKTMHGLTRFAVANKFRITASVSPKNLEKISGLNEADELGFQEKQHSVKHRAMQS
jgi:hypothetical protein